MKTPMVRYAWLAVVLGLAAAAAPAQSLLDNQYYKGAKDLLAQSQQALQLGDYDGAALLAVEARDALAKSDDYVATMTLFYRANGWLSQANDRIAYAKSINADTNYKDAYDKAAADALEARTALDAKDYQKSIDLSRGVVAALADIAPVIVAAKPAPEPVPPVEQPATPPVEQPAASPVEQPAVQPAGQLPLPAYYTLRSLHPVGDCFWIIAGYPFVYGNSWKWRLLYEANKSLLKDPNNPDLIEIGVRIVIPSANGETREGDYDPQMEYPSIAVP
jgi:hypothetical protein